MYFSFLENVQFVLAIIHRFSFRSIEPLSSHYLAIIERITNNNPQMQPVGDNRLQAFFDILKLPLRGGSLPNHKW